MRKNLVPLIRVLGETGVTALAIRHDNKSPQSAITAAGGSIAFSALGRSALRFGVDPADPELRILAIGKHNNSRRASSLSFRIPETSGDYPEIQWIGESPYSADDLINLAAESRHVRGRRQPTKTELATDFLRQELRVGPMGGETLKERAKQLGFGGSLDNAAEALGVRRQRIGFGKGSHVRWELSPEQEIIQHTRHDEHSLAVAEYDGGDCYGSTEEELPAESDSVFESLESTEDQ